MHFLDFFSMLPHPTLHNPPRFVVFRVFLFPTAHQGPARNCALIFWRNLKHLSRAKWKEWKLTPRHLQLIEQTSLCCTAAIGCLPALNTSTHTERPPVHTPLITRLLRTVLGIFHFPFNSTFHSFLPRSVHRPSLTIEQWETSVLPWNFKFPMAELPSERKTLAVLHFTLTYSLCHHCWLLLN